MKKVREERFEFILYINGNIICQRYFNIFNFNTRSIRSLDMKELADYCVYMIEADLREKAEDYLWGYHNPYVFQKPEEIQVKNVFENEDIFSFEIKIDKKSVAYKPFSGNFYPPKVRYTVDIRKSIPKIIREIQKTLSQKKYETKYLDQTL